MTLIQRTVICVVVCLVLFCKAYPQRTINGHIVEKTGLPVTAASVLAYRDSLFTPPMAGYSISQNNGSFSIELKESGDCWLLVRCIGYIDYSMKLTNQKDVGNIILTRDDNTLKEVIVKGFYTGVKVVGDTIKFDTNHFRNGFENTVNELLEKLPGISISEDGSLSYGGKVVRTLLVDGKNIFTRESQGLVVRNMSADIVTGAEVIQNYKEGNSTVMADRDKQTALNIKTNRKGNISGYVEGNYGFENKYHAKSFNLGTNERFSLTSIVSANNTGIPVFSVREYIIRLMGNKDLTSRGSSSFNLSDMEAGMLYRPDNIYEDRGSVASLDAKYEVSDALSITGNVLFNHTDVKGKTTRTETFLSEYPSTLESVVDNDKAGNMFMSNMETNWKPRSNVKLLAKLKLGANDIHDCQSAESNEVDGTNYVQSNRHKGYYIGGLVSSYIDMGVHQLYVKATANHTSKDRTANLTTRKWILPLKYMAFENDNYYFQNERDISTTCVSAVMGYNHKFSSDFNLDASMKYLYADNRMETSSITNSIENLRMQELSSDLLFKKIQGKWQYTIGSSFIVEHNSISPRFNNRNLKIFPVIDVEYNFNATKKLSISLSRSDELIETDKIMSAIMVNSYNEILLRSCINSPYQTGNKLYVNFFNYNIEKQCYFTVYANFQTVRNAVVSYINQEGIISTYTYDNDGKTDNFYATASLDKRLKEMPFNLKGSLSLSYLKTPSFVNGEDHTARSYALLSKINIMSKFQSIFNGELSLNYSHNRSSIAKVDINNDTDNFACQLKLLYLKDRWRCQAIVDYQSTKSDTYTSDFLDLGFKAEYKMTHLTLKFSALNLLHLKNNEWWRTITTANYSATEHYDRMHGYILLGMLWHY